MGAGLCVCVPCMASGGGPTQCVLVALAAGRGVYILAAWSASLTPCPAFRVKMLIPRG